ncbi:MAG TPA: Uma2 family endonuclease [Gemmatimonadales bacterium]|jgi:Uma2 family endonuclease|nr:Uma2 family endonuclease [Gemmatimonadales bacterium]
MTADELLKLHIPSKRIELVEGVAMVREPAGYVHGRVTMNLTARLVLHLRDVPEAGQLIAGATGFTLAKGPDTVRSPDIAYIRPGRVPHPKTQGFPELAPDLVVDVLSPEDRTREIQQRAGQWLAAGTHVVWVVDPRRQTTHVYRSDGTEEFIGTDGSLQGEDILPGFTCPLEAIM